jgi:O-antigen/teichoic acid export membrane protein
MAELHGTGEEKRLRRFYLKTTELTFFINLPLTILAFVLVPQFMTLWLGPAFSAASTWPFRLLLVGSTASLFSVMPNNLATGKGHPHLYAVFQGAKALLVMALWPSLIGRWGITGAAAGILAGEALTTPVFLGYIHARFLGVRWGEFWLNVCLRPLTAALGLAALGLATHAYVGTWFGMFAFAAAGMAGYFLIGYRLLDADAQSMLKEWAASRLQFRWR